MSADATGAILESRPRVFEMRQAEQLGCEGEGQSSDDLGWPAANAQGGRQEDAGEEA